MITHYKLCTETAIRFLKDSDVVVYEYQSFASDEHPDVLCFKSGITNLYEIKVSRSDFLADAKKDSRIKYRSKVQGYFRDKNNEDRLINKLMTPRERTRHLQLKAKNPELFYIEAPHLGRYRYYVCPWGLIQPEEVPESWGLYWFRESDKKFFKKKKSGNFRRNIHAEMSILSHAMRKYASEGGQTNILINKYI